ncbi:MAG TPA: PQQ-dependent sugar dehydrogenase [Gemmataceae bacterium]|nr:PQQ-dependent sugar dehydrogenase [Gemmataceae bacterium]
MASFSRLPPVPLRRGLLLIIPFLGALVLLLLGEQGQTPAESGKPFQPPPAEWECRWTETPLTIDGKADEDAWKRAQLIDNFYLPWLGSKARPARTTTKARLLWDREYLYFFADMEDSDLYADVKEHDGQTWNNDVFELFFKPAADKPGYYEFQINAAGTIMDMFLPRRGAGGYARFKSDGEFHIDAKVRLRGTLNHWQDKDQGWSVEGRIPWRDFLRTGGRPNIGERWKFALCRYDYSVDFEDGVELSTCAPLKSQPRPDFHHYEDYAALRFVGSPQKSAAKPHGIERRIPLTTSRVVGAPDPPPPYRVRRVYPNLKLDFPVAVAHQPGSDRLLIITQPAPYAPTTILRTQDDPNTDRTEKLLPYDGVAYDIAFHPKFKENGYIYIGMNGPSSAPPGAKKTRVLRYTMERQPPYTFDPQSETVILEWPSDGHNGGALAFGTDGMLYVTSGDGTSDSDTNIVGQDLSKLTAKVLRIDVDHPEPGKPYSVPKDNPFVGQKNACPETWAYGLRNPWRITVDQKTGHIWVGNNGQDLWEQAYWIEKGANYGWSVMEGSHPFYPSRKAGPTPFTKPTVEHSHSEARSLTGGIVYYGSKFPELQGVYIYGDYSTGKIWGVRHDGRRVTWHKELANTRLQITGFGVDAHGEILIADHRGQDKGGFYTFEATPKDLPPSAFPRKLSESGLFRSAKGHIMDPALIPYSVNAPLWSDGAYKERWIALPGADSRIDFTTNRGWNFPDKSVLVKSFALEMEEGNPASRHWIETRFLTNQQGEWFGYSYQWNDEQTDGVLVDGKGHDREFTIRVPSTADNPRGIRKQKWHYPSRTECMVCHSRAANFVLGLTELQMNKEHDYGGVRDNQLRVLEHLGVLRVNWMEETKDALMREAKAKGMTDGQIYGSLDKLTATRLQRGPAISSLLTVPPEKYRRLVDPSDRKQNLEARARSYLHANCAQCHVKEGGGNAKMELEFTTNPDQMRLIDVKPVHDSYGLPEARLISLGHPERSVLLHRIRHRDAGHMPPLATEIVDREAVQLMHDWIKQLADKNDRR